MFEPKLVISYNFNHSKLSIVSDELVYRICIYLHISTYIYICVYKSD